MKIPPITEPGIEATMRPLERGGLLVLLLVVVVTLVGFASFGLHPELLARYPDSASFYAIAFELFAQGQVWIAWAILALFLWGRAGGRWLVSFAVLYAVSLSSELSGTTVGLPFGEYRYSGGLGAKWFGHVPFVIPLSWFYMAVPSYGLARAALPGTASGVKRILFASLLLLSWDLCLDPAMSHATTYWIWGEPGSYYGMPWLNLFGWYVTGLALMSALALLDADEWVEKLPLRWLGGFYALNILLPLGMAAAAGLWGAVAATLAALGIAGVIMFRVVPTPLRTARSRVVA